MKDTDQIAAEAAREWAEYEGWPDSSDIAEMRKRFQSVIEEAREVWLMEQSEHIKTGAVESRAAHSSPAEVRASERWDGALTASNKDMDARMAEAASASEPPPQELRMIHRNGDLRWEINGKEEDFIASVEPSSASKICKAFYDKVYSHAAQASEPPQSRDRQGADTKRMDEVERLGMQVWPTRTKGEVTAWTAQYFIPHPYGEHCGKTAVQPTKPRLREAIDAALSQRRTKEGK